MYNNKVKILYVHHGSSNGGAPRSLKFLINMLPKNKFDISFLCMSDHKGNREMFKEHVDNFYYEHWMTSFNGSTVCDVRGFRNNFLQLIKVPITILNSYRYIKLIQPELVHINSTCIWPVACGVKMFNKIFKKNIKVKCHVREPLVDTFSGNIIKKMCAKYIDHFISIDKYDAQSLNVDFSKISIVYNFVDFVEYNTNIKSNVLREELSLSDNDFILLYLARIDRFNGTYDMIANLYDYLEKNRNIHLVIVGLEEKETEYKKMVFEKANRLKNIHFMKFRKDVPNVIASSNLMIVPFTEPHFSRSIIEAAAIGVPSIATNIGGPNELIIDGVTGIFFKKDFTNLVNVLDTIIKDKKIINSLGKNAAKHARENFNSKKNANKTINIYYEVLNREE